MDASSPGNVHLVGCLGSGMAALARLYVGLGWAVTGSDARALDPDARASVDRLERWGVQVTPHAAQTPTQPDLIVRSLAIPADHPELAGHRAVINRVEALRDLLAMLDIPVVAISGVTGKSTVTALTAQLLDQLCPLPLLYLGAELPGYTDQFHQAEPDQCAVVEACEVLGGMSRLPRTIAVISSVYWGEHPASYPTPASLTPAFRDFLAPSRVAVVPYDHRELAENHAVVTFGDARADIQLAAYEANPEGFVATYGVGGNEIVACTRLHGRHNAGNLAAALATLLAYGVPTEALRGLDYSALKPPRRRLERVGDLGRTALYDDFAHNPLQIAATHQALREMHPGASIAVHFQPRGFERLHAFGPRYAETLGLFDRVVVAPPMRTFEDTSATVDESKFADTIVTDLRHRGVDARVGGLADADELASCDVACVLDILPITATAARLRAHQNEIATTP